MANKHTPGPWHRNIPPAAKYPVIFAGRNTHICVVTKSHPMTDVECEANANLIAAAPALLAELDAIVDLPPDDEGNRVIPAGFLDGARAAIADAEA